MKFRKRPAVIDAEQFTEEGKNRVFNWMSGNRVADFEGDSPVLKFQTIHGDVAIARLGDWVVQDGKPGTYYPCKPDIFEQIYEPVE